MSSDAQPKEPTTEVKYDSSCTPMPRLYVNRCEAGDMAMPGVRYSEYAYRLATPEECSVARYREALEMIDSLLEDIDREWETTPQTVRVSVAAARQWTRGTLGPDQELDDE